MHKLATLSDQFKNSISIFDVEDFKSIIRDFAQNVAISSDVLGEDKSEIDLIIFLDESMLIFKNKDEIFSGASIREMQEFLDSCMDYAFREKLRKFSQNVFEFMRYNLEQNIIVELSIEEKETILWGYFKKYAANSTN